MENIYYIGLDVHKNSIAIAYTNSHAREEATFWGTCGGGLITVERKLRKLAKELGVKFQELQVCYEAGPTGFVLGRHLISLGVECVLCAPTKTERKRSPGVCKTDYTPNILSSARRRKTNVIFLSLITPRLL